LRAGKIGILLALAGFALLAVTVRSLQASRQPTLAAQEIRYARLAQSLAEGRGYGGGEARYPDYIQPPLFPSLAAVGVVGFLLAFVIIRYLDGFGNIRPRIGNTWIDFLNLVKYPPSMSFTLLTMGLNLILLGLFARAHDKLQAFFTPLVVYGRAPLFFYVVHLFLYVALGVWLTPKGTSLLMMYPYWLLGLLILFPMCFLYGRLKQQPQANRVLRFL